MQDLDMMDAEELYGQSVGNKLKAACAGIKGPEARARACYAVLLKCAEAIGQLPSEVILMEPGKPNYLPESCANQWGVAWEAGPYDWAIDASFKVMAEPYYGFDLLFWND